LLNLLSRMGAGVPRVGQNTVSWLGILFVEGPR
jgi:hypothetical protein